jgi:hypothetical protein
MITEIVYFNLAEGISRDELLAKYRATAENWSKNDDLVQKYYFFDEGTNRGGGVYIWKPREAAERWHGAAYQQRIRELYGDGLQMIRHDTLLVVDNVNSRLIEPQKA